MQSTNTPEQTKAGTSLATTSTARVPAADKPKRALKVKGKLKTALDLMVFGPADGDKAGLALDLADACRATGFHFSSMRKALERPHVRQYLNQQKQVFRAAASAQNISFAVKMRSDSGNAMAQLGAMKFIEADEQQSQRQNAAPTPGITIVIAGEGAKAAVQVNHPHSPDSGWPNKPDAEA